MNWYKKAQGYIPTTPYTYPYYLEEVIKNLGENGLALNNMDEAELKHAKELEQNGDIKKVIKQDEKGRYWAYILNKEKSVFAEEDTKIDKLVGKIMKGHKSWTPEELQLHLNHSKEIEKMLKEKSADFSLFQQKTAKQYKPPYSNYLEIGHDIGNCYLWAWIDGKMLVDGDCNHIHEEAWPELEDTDYRGRFDKGVVSVFNPFEGRDLPEPLYRLLYEEFGNKIKIVEFS